MAAFDEVNDKLFDAIVIGTGFGGSVAVTRLAAAGKRVLVLERGTWWGNPEGPGLSPQRSGPSPRLPGLEQRQYWPRPNDSRGLVYLLSSLYKEVHPLRDLLDPFVKDNDLGLRDNRKGLYRLTRFSDRHGKVDVVSGNGVGGGSLFYSGVNLIPTRAVLDRIGLTHLTSEHFRRAGEWMSAFRGRITKVNTKVPTPHRAPRPEAAQYQLASIPESGEPAPVPSFEMPDPDFTGHEHEKDYLHLDRARVLERAKERVDTDGGFVVEDAGVRRVAEASPFRPLPLSIVEYDPSHTGESSKKHAFCLREGRCITGCLPSARHTLYKTMEDLTQKNPDGFSVLPQTKVLHLSRRAAGGYTVHLQSFLEHEKGRVGRVHAAEVYLAAGCLGTSELMLRSRALHARSRGREGLPLPPTVGSGFSTNGDFFAFATGVGDADLTTPDAHRVGKPNPTVGPINSSGFHLVFGRESPQRIDLHIEDAGIPTLFARFLYELLPAMRRDPEALGDLARGFVRALMQKVPFSDASRPDTSRRNQEDYQTERELISDVFFFNAMGAGPDEPRGTFYLDEDGAMQLRYAPDRPLRDWSVFRHLDGVLEQLTRKMGGAFVPSPFWRQEGRVTVVHPLGGCPVGEDRTRGAVDRFGRVYDGSPEKGSTDVLPGLYVLDAAGLPGALAVNPTFTLVTQALYVMEHALPVA